MSPWAKRASRPVPSISARTLSFELDDYSGGMDNYIGNDKFSVKNGGTNKWRLAQNARINTLGEYETRQGFDLHSGIPASTLNVNLTAVTGASNKSFNEDTWLAQKITPTATKSVAYIQVNIRNTLSATGTPLFELWSDSGGAPGLLISRSSVSSSAVLSSYSYLTVYFPDAPAVTNGVSYWIVATVQPSGNNAYQWSSTTSATTSLTSTNSGTSWSANTFALNYRLVLSTASPASGLYRAQKSDGTTVTLFATGTELYKIDTSGGFTLIKSGLNANATRYRFWLVNDVVYYCNGYDGYRKWDFTTESQVNSINYTDLLVHKNRMMLVRADQPTRYDVSEKGDYETFLSTGFFYVPSPKTGDNITSGTTINGYLLIRTMNRCYMLSGEETDEFRLDAAPDQKGTWSPETSVADKNYTYFLSDDGVYRSNGTEPFLMSKNIYTSVLNIQNKMGCCLAINRGRLYLWYASAGSAYNDSCYVWNLNAGNDVVESHDTGAYVCRAISSYTDQDYLLVGNSRIGQVMWQELSSNDYTNLGGDIDFLLQSHYYVGSSPAILKEVRYWNTRFGAADDNYVVGCEYAYDLRDNWQVQNYVDVQGVGSIWGDAAMVWGSFTWGASTEVHSSTYIPGEYRRVAVRYTHFATRQPVKFLGHDFRAQERRMR